MKKKIIILTILVLICINITGCGNKYKGYWCNYTETSTIVVLLNRENTSDSRKQIEKKINNFENLESYHYYSRDDYAAELGENTDNLDIYDTYVISFNSMDHIGTYREELEKTKDVRSAEQSNAKTNISLYNIKNWGKYTFTNSDEASESELEKGKYKLKNGVITFKPEKDSEKTTLLYTKDGLLCGDADCTKIYARSNSTCSGNSESN